MPQIKPEYEQLDEFMKIGDRLIQKYPEILNGIDSSSITCVMVTNKEPKETIPQVELRPVPYPIRLHCPYDYIAVVFQADWLGMDEKHKALLVFNTLCRLDPQEPGKVVPFDLKDHSVMIRTLMADYMKRPDVPDILNETIEWKKE